MTGNISKEEKLLRKGRKRQNFVQLFVKRLVPTFIVGAMFGTLAVYGTTLYFSKSVLYNTTYIESVGKSVVADTYEKGDTVNAQWRLSLISNLSYDGMSEYAAGIKDIDANETLMVSEKKILLALGNKESNTESGAYFIAPSSQAFMEDIFAKYDPLTASETGYVYAYKAKKFLLGDKEFFPLEVDVYNALDDTLIEKFTNNSAVPEGFSEADVNDYAYANIGAEGLAENAAALQAVKKNLDEVTEKSATAIERVNWCEIPTSATRWSFFKMNGKTYEFVSETIINTDRIVGMAALPTSISVAVVVLIISLLWAYASYSSLKAHYAMEDYRKEMTNAMAHDLKSPLMAISGYAENLLNNTNEEKRSHYAEAISENVEYMDGIIANVLELSKLESNTAVTDKTEYDIPVNVMEIISKYRPQLDDRKIRTVINGNGKIIADKSLMTIALENLISNAVKYTDDSGSITVTASSGRVTVTNDCRDADKLNTEEICKPFKRGSGSRSGKGSGLGLAIVKNIAQLHDFDFTVSCKDNKFTAEISQR